MLRKIVKFVDVEPKTDGSATNMLTETLLNRALLNKLRDHRVWPYGGPQVPTCLYNSIVTSTKTVDVTRLCRRDVASTKLAGNGNES